MCRAHVPTVVRLRGGTGLRSAEPGGGVPAGLAVGLNRFVNQLTLISQRSDLWIGDRHAQGRGCILLHLRCPLDHLHGTRLHGNRVGLGGQSSIFILAAAPALPANRALMRVCNGSSFPTETGHQGSCSIAVSGTAPRRVSAFSSRPTNQTAWHSVPTLLPRAEALMLWQARVWLPICHNPRVRAGRAT
jgi:hypothetical protein